MDDDADRFAILAMLGVALALAAATLLGFTAVGLAIALVVLTVPLAVMAVPVVKALARRCVRLAEREVVAERRADGVPPGSVGGPVRPGMHPAPRRHRPEKAADETLPGQPS